VSQQELQEFTCSAVAGLETMKKAASEMKVDDGELKRGGEGEMKLKERG
jgi:hypothetical protein